MPLKSKKLYLVPLISGIILIVVSALILTKDIVQRIEMTEHASSYVTEFENIIPERTNGTSDSSSNEAQKNTMPIMTVNGKGLIGIIEYNGGKRKFPVYSEYTKDIASPRPCYYSGSTLSSNLVVIASKDKGQFDFVDEIEEGDKFTFVDVFGRQYIYHFVEIKHMESRKASEIEAYDGMTIAIESLNGYVLIHAMI